MLVYTNQCIYLPVDMLNEDALWFTEEIDFMVVEWDQRIFEVALGVARRSAFTWLYSVLAPCYRYTKVNKSSILLGLFPSYKSLSAYLWILMISLQTASFMETAPRNIALHLWLIWMTQISHFFLLLKLCVWRRLPWINRAYIDIIKIVLFRSFVLFFSFQSRKRAQKVHEIYNKLLEQPDIDPTLV